MDDLDRVDVVIQPYRTASVRVMLPARIETVRLRRYPIWIQIFWLVWFPFIALFIGQLVPVMTLSCTRTHDVRPYCTLDEARLTGLRRYELEGENAVWVRESIRALNDGNDDAHLVVNGTLEMSEEPPERFLFERTDARQIKAGYDAFRNGSDLGAYRNVLRDVRWLFGLCAAGELLIVALFVVRQRRIEIAINADTGHVGIDDRRYFRKPKHRSVDLGEVAELELVFIDQDEGHGRRVLASIIDRDVPCELFEAFDAEAQRGFQLCERAHARWTAEHPRES